MRDIDVYKNVLDQNPNLDSANFFIDSNYKSENKQSYACYLLTKKGCDMVANKMTGEKGILFTATYVTKFEEMEQGLKSVQPQLSKEFQALFILDKRTMEIDNRLVKLENNMTIDYSQQEELRERANKRVVQALGGKDAPAYKECNKKAFSELWRAFKRVMQVNSYKNTATKDYVKAQLLLTNWKPNRDLELMILGANSQISFVGKC